MTKIYCLDSGVFINSWNKLFPMDVFPSVWGHFDRLCHSKSVFVPEQVAEEVSKGDDDVWKWLKIRRKSIIKTDQNIINQVEEIIAHHPRLTAEGGKRSAADPWVISFALTKRAVVVTEEQASGKLAKPKIPDVCWNLNVECINTVQFLRATGFSCTCLQQYGDPET